MAGFVAFRARVNVFADRILLFTAGSYFLLSS